MEATNRNTKRKNTRKKRESFFVLFAVRKGSGLECRRDCRYKRSGVAVLRYGQARGLDRADCQINPWIGQVRAASPAAFVGDDLLQLLSLTSSTSYILDITKNIPSPTPVHPSFAVPASLCFSSCSSNQYPGPAKQRHRATHQGKKISKNDTA